MSAGVSRRLFIDALEYSKWDRELFEELKAGDLSAVHVTVSYWENARETISAIGKWNRLFHEHSDLIVPCRDASDIIKAQSSRKTAIILGFQNSSPIEDELALVEVFYDLGIRIMQLTYNNQSLLGGGCFEPVDSGVSQFGRKVIKEMNRVGMVVDLSHSGERTTLDSIEISERPVTITHGNPAEFQPGPRSKSRHVIEAIGRSGGMLGFSLYPLHIAGGSNCRLDQFCQMVADTAELIGTDHIGIGSDMCRKFGYETLEWMRKGKWTFSENFAEDTSGQRAWPEWPSWFQSPTDFPCLEAGLRGVGFSPEETAKIMGGNWLRYFADSFGPSAKQILPDSSSPDTHCLLALWRRQQE